MAAARSAPARGTEYSLRVKHRISAGAIVEHEGRILLVRYRALGGVDFWVGPGGGAEGTEDLPSTARREAKEETGLDVHIDRMLYVEEFHDTTTRFCKIWFAASVMGNAVPRPTPEAAAEGIVEVAWLSRAEIGARIVFPAVLGGQYWDDRAAGFSSVRHLPMHPMTL